VAYNIPEILTSRKATDSILIASIILLSVLSFGLGRLSVSEVSNQGGVALCEALPARVQTASVALSGAPKESADVPGEVKTQGTYVGSKNGSVYHFPWCSGAQRIKDENKVWFATKEEAERAGYRPASNCKGL